MTSTSSQSDALPNSQGRFGPYGGKFVPETLMAALAELETAYDEARQDDSFWSEFEDLLKNYVGRPTAMYHAKNLTEQLGGAEIYIKREDLNHTGAHKINNAIGQALLARRLGKRRIIAETGAGQHGVATATVCARFGLPCIVYMGAADIERRLARKASRPEKDIDPFLVAVARRGIVRADPGPDPTHTSHHRLEIGHRAGGNTPPQRRGVTQLREHA